MASISIVDALYLLPLSSWPAVFSRCHEALRPNGVLVLKEMDPSLRLRAKVLRLEERLAVKTLGWTKGGDALSFPSTTAVTQALRSSGFGRVSERALHRGYHVPHFLWRAEV